LLLTLALGMGVDCKNVSQTVYVGLLDDVSAIFKRQGGVGRDGLIVFGQ